jgi:2',3'-cyclic-nucleotide 2'-phosphodiesterase (5'-nucleotidase family)
MDIPRHGLGFMEMGNKYKNNLFIYLLLLVLHINILHPNELRILYTSSLNGNLDGCTCKVNPISGLVKRGYWIEEYRNKYPNVIIVDTGDSISDARDLKKAKAIYESFSLLKYDAYLPGESDFSIGVQNFFETSKNANLIGTNFIYNPGIFSKSIIFGSHEKTLDLNNIRVRILGLLHEDTMLYVPNDIRSKIKFINEKFIPKYNPNYQVTILLTHAGVERDTKLISNIDFPLLVIGGHDQYQPKNGGGFELSGGIWYFQSGADGNQIGEIVLEVDNSSNFKIISHKLHSIDYSTTPDHSLIREVILNLRKNN